MKYLTFIIQLFLFCIFFQNAHSQCTANFTFDETGLSIQFTDLSSAEPNDPVVSWLWDFEDGTTSTTQNPLHTFPEPGIYDVLLSITTSSGCTSEFEIQIETCAFGITITPGACNPDGTITLSIAVNDIFDNAKDIDITIDGQLLPGSPFEIDADNPVLINHNIMGDGLSHTLMVQSTDIGTCSKSLDFTVEDCTSDCFLSGIAIDLQSTSTHTIEIGDNFFSPVTSTINLGDLVRFNWTGDGHSTTSDATSGPDSWNSGVIDAGSVFEVSIQQPGIHPYYCIPHGGSGGVGMSGSIVANCPSDGSIPLVLTFQSSQINAAGFNFYLDNILWSGSPFNYNGTGAQSVLLNLPGDGLLHQFIVEDVNDPSCSLTANWQAPDCGATPECNLSLTAVESGPCDASDNIAVDLTITAINPGTTGFNLTIDGVPHPQNPFSYTSGGSTSVTIDLPGDGNTHNLVVNDIDQNNCSATTSIVSTNCTIPCSINNLNVISDQATTHIVNVEDFSFNPADIIITEGDIIEWQWTGNIPHTSTSDATTGTDSWDSGLLDNGASFQSPVLSIGLHPYYCIPHGGPGGVGMSGSITVQPNCTNGMVSVNLQFQHSGGSFNGFQVFVDNTLEGNYNYNPSGTNTLNLLLPGDGQNHIIDIMDSDNPSCIATTSVVTADCNTSNCQLNISAVENGPCDNIDQVSVLVTINDTNGNPSGFQLTLDGNSVGDFNYDPSGSTVLNINLPGDGLEHIIQVNDLEDVSCTAQKVFTTTLCTPPPCSIDLTATQVSPCNNNQVEYLININASSQGPSFNLSIDGNFIPGSPFDYNGGSTDLLIELPGDGASHQIIVTDTSDPDCNQSISITTSDCTGACSFEDFNFTEHIPSKHIIEVEDFTFTPQDITVEVGDTILWIWTGLIPHTTTSDTVSGDDSWNSGLLSEGDEFSIIIQHAGFHPYYCIPHGSPGGIGMSGTITVVDICEDEVLHPQFTFTNNNTGLNGYQILIDGTPLIGNPFNYNNVGLNTVSLDLPASGQVFNFTIEDLDDTSCRLDTTLQMPSCSDPCFGFTADFSTLIDHPNLEVEFTSLTQNVQQWFWSFGDGGTSSEEQPIHQFAIEGTYEVCLTVENDLACTDQYCISIEVGTYQCLPAFTYEVDGLTVNFLEHSTTTDSITNWLWSFGDGFQQQGLANPSYTYDSLGIYEVCLDLIAGDCVADTCLFIDLSDPCLSFGVNFDYSVNEIDNSIQFIDLTNGTPNQWLWGFGDGQTSNEQHPVHHYNALGVYNVCLLVQDTVLGCNRSLCTSIEILVTGTTIINTTKPLIIYPNPSKSGQFWNIHGIDPLDYGKPVQWSLLDLRGQQLDGGYFSAAERVAHSISKTLAPGIYIIQLFTDQQQYLGKLIIQ
jgi:plastocyanin